MNMYRDRVHDYLSTAEGQKAFIEWLSDPCTQLMLGAAREAALPAPRTAPPDASEALYQLGITVGGNYIIDLLQNPRSGTVGLGEATKRPVPTYGAAVILKEMSHAQSGPPNPS